MDFSLLPPDKRWVSEEKELENILAEVLDPLEALPGRLTPPTPPEAKRMRLFLEGQDVLSELEALPCPLSLFEKTDQRSGWTPEPLPEIPRFSSSPEPEAASEKWPYRHAGLFREYGGVKAFIEKEIQRIRITDSSSVAPA